MNPSSRPSSPRIFPQRHGTSLAVVIFSAGEMAIRGHHGGCGAVRAAARPWSRHPATNAGVIAFAWRKGDPPALTAPRSVIWGS